MNYIVCFFMKFKSRWVSSLTLFPTVNIVQELKTWIYVIYFIYIYIEDEDEDEDESKKHSIN